MTGWEGLASAVRRSLQRRAVRKGDEASPVEVRAILNWGGFGNRSFEVRAGGDRYHLKLATEAHSLPGLVQWRTLRGSLERSYRAPAMVDWLDLEDTGFSGPLFRWIGGSAPDRISPELFETVAPVLDRLHADRDLAETLRELGHPVGTCADAYLATIHDRFVEDLSGIARSLPPFVDRPALAWMEEQVRAAEAVVRASSAFGTSADRPVHTDLWIDNILVQDGGRVWLLDWDDLRLGDPVMDWATLLGPNRRDLRPATERLSYLGGRLDEAERERLRVWARATSLDWVIDPLADWVEAASDPRHRDTVRGRNEELYARAVEAYRTLWT